MSYLFYFIFCPLKLMRSAAVATRKAREPSSSLTDSALSHLDYLWGRVGGVMDADVTKIVSQRSSRWGS